MSFLTLSKVKLTVSVTTTKGYIQKKSFVLDDVEKSALDIPFNLIAQTVKNVGFVVRCKECQKPRLAHSKLEIEERRVTGSTKNDKEIIL